MSDFLIRTDFEVNLPQSPVARGQWLLKNGVPDETVRVLKGKLTCFHWLEHSTSLGRTRTRNGEATPTKVSQTDNCE